MTVSASIGVWFLAASTEGRFGGRPAMPLRDLTFAAALRLIYPGMMTDLVGLAIGISVCAYQRLRRGAVSV